MNVEEFYKEVNDTSVDYPVGAGLHQLMAETAKKLEDKIAVVCEDQSVTYEQFENQSNRFANYLIGIGVQKGDLVGVCCDRNQDLPVILNGILRSGAGYVPLDPDYPSDRLTYMVEDAGLKHVVAHRGQLARTKQFNVQVHDYESLQTEIQSQPDSMPTISVDVDNDIAYVIYTSGSTGKPKGVLVPHRSVVNLMYAFQRIPGFTSEDRFIATTTLSFDISVVEIFLPLCSGGQLVVVDRETAKDPSRLNQVIEHNQISFMQATPSHWRILCESEFVGGSHLKCLTGGEKLPRDLIEPMLERCGELWNCYGPTEATVWSSAQRILEPEERILVGKPLDNTTAYIVDGNNQLCSAEQEGELLIGGVCVTKGYLNREELTQERFIEFRGERVYRSGDLAKILESGEIEVLDRIDNQIKLRGHRIELDEIDFAMNSADSGVKQAAAVVQTTKNGE